VDNKRQFIKIINWILRYSLLHTLAHKKGLTLNKIIKIYSKTPTIQKITKKGILQKVIKYVDPLTVHTLKKKFLVSENNILDSFLKEINKI
jgi:hypothetical protein